MYNFIGHDLVRSWVKDAVKAGSLPHAHLITGQDGIGKSYLAREIASNILNVENDKPHVDIIEFRTEKKSFGVDEVRMIIEEVNKKPFSGDKKVIIVYHGEKLTVQAQNAFLKTIEEPPMGVHIIITTESTEYLLDTIKSRCQIHKLLRLSKEQMSKFLKLHFPDIDSETYAMAIAFSDGIPGRVERFLRDEEFNDIRSITLKILEDILSKDETLVIKYEVELAKYKNKEDDILNSLLSFIRDIMIFKDLENSRIIVNRDKLRDIENLANRFSYTKLYELIEIINKSREAFFSNVSSAVTYDIMLLNMLEV
ncbi:MAG: DNA polymerase III subunit delta' [Clostridiaceae bacterium]